MRHIFIVNPKAGRRDQTARIFAMAEGLRKRHGLDCACMLTQSPGHAARLCREEAEKGGAVRLYACGGDGTIYEAANGAAGYPNAAVTCIPTGTGNDFLKNFGPDAALFADAENLWDGDEWPLDLIECNGRLCLTIACTGVDARVAESVHRYSRTPWLSGRGSYLAAVAANLVFGKVDRRWQVTLDGERLEDDFALVSTCNGRYYGGGSMPVPQARMRDGVLETILVRKLSKAAFARLFSDYSAGNGARHPRAVRVVTAREVRIRSDGEALTTCLDGECFHAQEVRLRLSEKKLNFFGPKGADPDSTAR